jgi:hypothetical protein
MGWKMSRLSSSLMGLLREPEPATGSPSQLEHIRQEMLACLAAHLRDPVNPPRVQAKVLHAQDMQALWYLRSDLMHLLCDRCGEASASAILDRITEMFRGHLPTAQFASARRRG